MLWKSLDIGHLYQGQSMVICILKCETNHRKLLSGNNLTLVMAIKVNNGHTYLNDKTIANDVLEIF